eukprot:scaffold240115_cov18-Prasinocladus_malaysianus.AAC.1
MVRDCDYLLVSIALIKLYGFLAGKCFDMNLTGLSSTDRCVTNMLLVAAVLSLIVGWILSRDFADADSPSALSVATK